MVEAGRIDTDTNANIRLNKAKSQSRIDALAALVNAEFIAARHPEEVKSREGMSAEEMRDKFSFWKEINRESGEHPSMRIEAHNGGEPE